MLARALPAADDYQYAVTRSVYPALSAACAHTRGVVLADQNDGHYIRFHTQCAVIANNFILTPQHVRMNQFAERLLGGSLNALVKEAPYVRYIYVRRNDNVLDDANTCAREVCPKNAGVRQTLLFGDAPPSLRLVYAVSLDRGGVREPLARIYEITGTTPTLR